MTEEEKKEEVDSSQTEESEDSGDTSDDSTDDTSDDEVSCPSVKDESTQTSVQNGEAERTPSQPSHPDTKSPKGRKKPETVTVGTNTCDGCFCPNGSSSSCEESLCKPKPVSHSLYDNADSIYRITDVIVRRSGGDEDNEETEDSEDDIPYGTERGPGIPGVWNPNNPNRPGARKEESDDYEESSSDDGEDNSAEEESDVEVDDKKDSAGEDDLSEEDEESVVKEEEGTVEEDDSAAEGDDYSSCTSDTDIGDPVHFDFSDGELDPTWEEELARREKAGERVVRPGDNYNEPFKKPSEPVTDEEKENEIMEKKEVKDLDEDVGIKHEHLEEDMPDKVAHLTDIKSVEVADDESQVEIMQKKRKLDDLVGEDVGNKHLRLEEDKDEKKE